MANLLKAWAYHTLIAVGAVTAVLFICWTLMLLGGLL